MDMDGTVFYRCECYIYVVIILRCYFTIVCTFCVLLGLSYVVYFLCWCFSLGFFWGEGGVDLRMD